MKALIIYISVHHDNTEKVAKVMANTLDAALLEMKQASASMLEQYDLIGFGSGIYFGKHHENLLDFVDKLPMLRNKKAFIFSTSGLRKIRFIHDFDKPLKEKLRQKGFDIIGEFSCRGLDTYRATKLVGGINRGRPNAKDLKQAEDFARSLKNSGGIIPIS
ncbi:MAG: flavodoxin family protein [Dehalococcoidia bacterium]